MHDITRWTSHELSAMSKLGARVRQLQEDVPTREDGLPLGYVDSAVLATLTPSDDPSAAIVPISYLDGFPTVNGVPIWERLENECFEHYELFKAYRDMYHSEDTRSIHEIARRKNVRVECVQALALLNHWAIRCSAYDKWVDTVRENTRQRMIRDLEGEHAKAARKIFNKCMDYIDRQFSNIPPKQVLEWFQTAVKLHRLSLGLSPDKPPTHGEGGEKITPTININQQFNSSGGEMPSMNSSKEMMQILSILKDSGVLDSEQEVIDIESDGGSTSAAEENNNSKDD